MARIDRRKRALGTAVRRSKASRVAVYLVNRGLVRGRVLDYGCGFGFDADHFGWACYDPLHRPTEPEGAYDTIVCNLVLNTLSRNRRTEVVTRIRSLLSETGRAYLAVARDLPVTGKLGVRHSLQNYIVLTLPSVFRDESFEIYELRKDARFDDVTRDFLSRRDRARAR